MLGLAIGGRGDARNTVHGVAACFGAIPMLKALEILGEPFERLVLINPLPDLPVRKLPGVFWVGHKNRAGHGRWKPGQLAGSLAGLLDRLFPQVPKSPGRFGNLLLSRVRPMEILADFIRFRPLEGTVLRETSVLCIFGRNDPVLNTFWNLEPGAGYQTAFLRICPDVEFLAVDGDHFLSDPAVRNEVLDAASDFLTRSRRRRGRQPTGEAASERSGRAPA